MCGMQFSEAGIQHGSVEKAFPIQEQLHAQHRTSIMTDDGSRPAADTAAQLSDQLEAGVVISRLKRVPNLQNPI